MKKKRITDKTFGRRITLFWNCTEIEFEEYLINKYKLEEKNPDGQTAKHVVVSNNGIHCHHFIWVGFNEFSITNYQVIAHEVFHCSMSCLEEIGLTYCQETREAFAYYHDWLFGEVLEILLNDYDSRGNL